VAVLLGQKVPGLALGCSGHCNRGETSSPSKHTHFLSLPGKEEEGVPGRASETLSNGQGSLCRLHPMMAGCLLSAAGSP
jgi:hypothetical protein